MKAREMRKLASGELEQKLAALHQEAFALRFRQAVGQVENTARIGAVKREIARVLTVKSELANKAKEN